MMASPKKKGGRSVNRLVDIGKQFYRPSYNAISAFKPMIGLASAR